MIKIFYKYFLLSVMTIFFFQNIYGIEQAYQSNGEKTITKISQEQESFDPIRNDAILFLVTGPILGSFYFEYQHAFSTRHSFLVGAMYSNPMYNGDNIFDVLLMYRYKLIEDNKGPLNGFGIVPGIQIATPIDVDKSIFVIGPVLYLQYQWVLRSGFTIELFAGAAGFILLDYPTGTKYDNYANMITPSIGLELGYAF